MNILKILHEIAENEHEKLKIFKSRLIEFCTGRKDAVYIEVELSECLDGCIQVATLTLVWKTFLCNLMRE